MEGELLPPPPPKGQHGGRRAGAGAKKGISIKRDTHTVNRLLRDGEAAPIVVLVHNMRFYWTRAEALTERLEDAEKIFDELTPEMLLKVISDEKAYKAMQNRLDHLHKLYARVEKFRDKAQEAAVDAAPYMHPKLAAMQVKVEGGGDSKQPPLDISPGSSAREAVDFYAQYLRDQGAVDQTSTNEATIYPPSD